MTSSATSRTGLLDRVLERWGLDAVTPGAPDLERLHAAYLRNVPFENATKLVKAARAKGPDAAIRGPVEFWEDHLRWGSGGTCFSSTSAYLFLLRYLGFESRYVYCQLPAADPRAHVALTVTVEGKPYLVDVGYALPAPVPLPESGQVRRDTPYYDIELRSGPGGEVLVFTEDDRGQRFRYRVQPRPVSDAGFQEGWRLTFRREAPYMQRLALGRFDGDTRYLLKDPRSIYVIDRQGERAEPLPEPAVPVLSDRFRMPQPLLDAAVRTLNRG